MLSGYLLGRILNGMGATWPFPKGEIRQGAPNTREMSEKDENRQKLPNYVQKKYFETRSMAQLCVFEIPFPWLSHTCRVWHSRPARCPPLLSQHDTNRRGLLLTSAAHPSCLCHVEELGMPISCVNLHTLFHCSLVAHVRLCPTDNLSSICPLPQMSSDAHDSSMAQRLAQLASAQQCAEENGRQAGEKLAQLQRQWGEETAGLRSKLEAATGMFGGS